MCSPPLAGANTRSSPTSTLPSVPALLLQERLRHPSSHARTPEHGRLAQLWLRSTAVERRGRSLPHRPRTRRRRVFDRLVEQAACRGLLDLTYSIDSTDVRTMPADQDASKGYDPTAEEYYHGYGCTIVSTGQKIPIAAEFTGASKRQRRRRCASRVTRSPSRNRSGCLETAPTTRSAGTTTCWPQGRASRSVQRTKHRRSERHRVQGRSPHRRTQRGRSAEAIDARRDVQPPEWSRTNQRRRQDCGLGHVRARGRVHARAQVFLALCLRLVIAITNDERGDNPGSTVITL